MNIISTIGDPNGIGIECLFKSLEYLTVNEKWFDDVEFQIAGNMQIIDTYLETLGKKHIVENDCLIINDRKFKVIEVCDYATPELGKVTLEAGAVSASSIEFALRETIAGRANALITMPIAKESIRLAGWKFPGHTEMIANACKVKHPLMILFHKDLRVGLVSIHTPLSDVHYEVTCSQIISTASALHNSLIKDFGIAKPTIGVLGLNPHAGENGNIGSEETEIIKPAIAKLQARGINAMGPFPADGFFGFGQYKQFDGVLAMYHDQGLIPLKLLADGDGVNFTAGLPIIRTSPDHGTAFAIAGKDIASHKSTTSSIVAAYNIYRNRS